MKEAFQLKNRVSFRKAMKKAIELTKKADIKGVKVKIAGHLEGKEIARPLYFFHFLILYSAIPSLPGRPIDYFPID
jgi:ribosomal protein S3